MGDVKVNKSAQTAISLDTIDDARAILYRDIDVSPSYAQKIDNVLLRMRQRGMNPQNFGSIHYGGRFLADMALAGVLPTNEMLVGVAAGSEDWDLELIMAHEFRHQLQNEARWRNIAQSDNLNPDACNLQCALANPEASDTLSMSFQKYLNTSGDSPTIELEAYLYAQDYYTAFIEQGLDPARQVIFLAGQKRRMEYYLSNTVTIVLTGGEEIGRKAVKTLEVINNGIQKATNDPNFTVQYQNYVQETYRRYSDTLHFENGTELNLQERLLYLPAGLSTLTVMADIEGETIRKSAAGEYAEKIDSMLNRQTLGYSRLFRTSLEQALDYRNDLAHTTDGAFRSQLFAEHAFGGEEKSKIETDTKIGADFGFYGHLSDHLFTKIAPAIYAGYQRGSGNIEGGGRLDLEFHLDIDVTQRLGLSVFAGYILGAQLGTHQADGTLDGYDEARLGAQLFYY